MKQDSRKPSSHLIADLPPPSVFVSSTWVDLAPHRRRVQEAIRQFGAIDISMESFGARDERPKAECLRLIRQQTDFFVGIYAHRYGKIPQGESVSITEAEYQQASKSGIPRLIYMLDETVEWKPQHIDKGRAAKKLAEFKDRLRARHTFRAFQNKDDLAASVVADLGRELIFRILPRVSKDSKAPIRSVPDWSKARIDIYREARNVFLAHTLEHSKMAGQLFEIAIYLIPHRSNDPRYRRENLSDVREAEFFLGEYWGNKIFKATERHGFIGITTSAYGPFLCICRVHFQDRSTVLLSRYIDFEMGRKIV